MSGERSEKPSEQRKRKSREKGEGVRSRELTSAAAMLAGLLLLRAASGRFVQTWGSIYTAALARGSSSHSVTAGLLTEGAPALLATGMMPVVAVMVAALAGAVAVGAAQSGGLQVHVETLAWKPSRMSPLKNLKGIFSGRSVLRFAKSMIPAAGVLVLSTTMLRGMVLPMPVLSGARLPATFAAAYRLALNAAWISVGWAALDYANEWRQWNSGLRMTKQDVKQEMKESNGNPHTKGRVRQIQRAMRRRRVKANVEKAAVVITNPTHYAVALLFDYEAMGAPRVLAKGRDLHAFAIREQAQWSGVPIVENPPLARSLYRSVEEGQAIPAELYAAVAAILAFLLRESRERSVRQAAHGAGYSAIPRTLLPVVEHVPAPVEGI